MNIESIISKRLSTTGKVHLSGWGTFYLKEQKVRWNHITNTAFPAGKYLNFSPNPSSEMDTLVPEVMKSLGASMEVAEQWIARKIKGWQDVLDAGNVLMLPGLGSFPTQNRFQAEAGTFDAQSFGFVPVMIHKLEEPSALQSKVVASLKVATESKQGTLKAWQRAGAAAAVAALFSLGVMQSSVVTQMAGWLSSTELLDSEEPVSIDVPNTTPAVEEVQSSDMPEENTRESVTPMVTSRSYNNGYSIVVGSFREEGNAKNYATELANKGLEVNIIEGSLNKVGIGHYQNRAEAVKAISNLKATVNSGAWIYAY